MKLHIHIFSSSFSDGKGTSWTVEGDEEENEEKLKRDKIGRDLEGKTKYKKIEI